MELHQYLYKEYENDINGVFLFFNDFQIIKELDEKLTDFLWYMRSFIQKQNNVSYFFLKYSIKDNLIEKLQGIMDYLEKEYFIIEIKPFHMKLQKTT